MERGAHRLQMKLSNEVLDEYAHAINRELAILLVAACSPLISASSCCNLTCSVRAGPPRS